MSSEEYANSHAAALRALLLRCLSEKELERLVRDCFGSGVANALPIGGSKEDFFESAVDVLMRRGLISGAFFRVLVSIAPGRYSEIAALVPSFGVEFSPHEAPMGHRAESLSALQTPRRPTAHPPLSSSADEPQGATPLVAGFRKYRYSIIRIESGDATRISFSFKGNRKVNVEGFLGLPPDAKFVLSSRSELLSAHILNVDVFVQVVGSEHLSVGDSFRIGGLQFTLDASPGLGQYIRYVYAGKDEIVIIPPEGLLLGRDVGLRGFSEDSSISRRHARLICIERGRVFLTDTGSTNGTYIKKLGEFALKHGSQFAIGEWTYRIEVNGVG